MDRHRWSGRSEWSEFSLRPRPQKTNTFQAGHNSGNGTPTDIDDVTPDRRTVDNMSKCLDTKRSCLRKNSMKSDSVSGNKRPTRYSQLPPIEQDVLFIASSLRDCCAGSKEDEDITSARRICDDATLSVDSDEETLTVRYQGKNYIRECRFGMKNSSLRKRDLRGKVNNEAVNRTIRPADDTLINLPQPAPPSATRGSVILPDMVYEEFILYNPTWGKTSHFYLPDSNCCHETDIGPDLLSYGEMCLDVENIEGDKDAYDDIVGSSNDCVAHPNGQLESTMTDLEMFEDPPEAKRKIAGLKPETESDRKEQQTMADKCYVGRLVWAKFTKTRWWPAIVISHDMCCQEAPKPGWHWLMWFGDYLISKRKANQTVCITHEFKQKVSGTLSHSLEEAITEALQECARRASLTDYLTYQGARDWGLLTQGFVTFVEDQGHNDPFRQTPDLNMPLLVRKSLKALQEKFGKEPQVDFHKVQNHSNFTDLLKKAKSCPEKIKTVDRCISCGKEDQILTCQHPLFKGQVCLPCKESLRESLLAFDHDGCSLFCCICGEGGSLYVCEASGCGRSYCHDCMRRYLPGEVLREINQQNVWECFLCGPVNQSISESLVAREDRDLCLVQFMNPLSCTKQVFGISTSPTQPRQAFRVLTLGDCLATVKLALTSLDVSLEMYAIAECDGNAWAIIDYNHKQDCKLLGDIWDINANMLEELWPIDLVVASPPTDDLDVTNQEYEGFNGTAWSFVKVREILHELRLLNATSCEPQRPLYWLIETITTIKSQLRQKLTALFQMEPCMWDSQWFCPCVQPKLYWGNIPNLYSAVEFSQSRRDISAVGDFLSLNFNRKARVDKIQLSALIDSEDVDENEEVEMEDNDDDNDPLLAKLASKETEDDVAKQLDDIVQETELNCEDNEPAKDVSLEDSRFRNNKTEDSNECVQKEPILMDGQPDGIWIYELEKLLGYPAHYTDYPGLPLNQRFKLLHQASSPRVLQHILSSLSKTGSK